MSIFKNESGQGLTEYIVLLLLVCVVSITTVKTLGSRVKSKLAEASNHINSELTLKDGGGSGNTSANAGNGGGPNSSEDGN